MPRCPHNRTQQWTHMCLDCGRNEHETDEQYLAWLRSEKARRENPTLYEIDKLERELGIKHPGNTPKESKGDGFGYDI